MSGKRGGKQGKQEQNARRTNARFLRLVLPFVVAIVAGVIVWLASSRGTAPVAGGGTRAVDTALPQLINAVLAGLAALMITVIIVHVVARRRSR